MEVSRLQFSQATIAALNSRPMTATAKAKLRRERVKDYIREHPAGAIIKQYDLAIAAGYGKSQGHGWAFIERMVKNKHIIKDTSEGSRRPSWTVNERTPAKPIKKVDRDINVPTKKPEKIDLKTDGAVKPRPPVDEFKIQLKSFKDLEQVSAGWVMQRAKDFAWQYNSDSLRDFIKHIEISNK